MEKVTLATVALNVSFDKKENVKKYLHFVEEAAKKGAKLIVFPEQSLQGYLKNLAGPLTIETTRHQYENAEIIPEGETTQSMIQAAKKHEIYIIWGMTERDRNRFDVLYNSAVLVGPEGFVGSYRKVHQPLDESHVYYPGDDFPVYDTAIGKIGMLICYDKSFPESTRELALRGAEILVMPTAWPMSRVGADPNTDSMGYFYDLFDRVRAVENGCWFISSNHIGVSGDHDYYGHSQIVGPGGVVKVSTGYNECLVMNEVDLRGEILRARTEDFVGLYMIKDRRPHAYRELNSNYHAGPIKVAGQTPLQNRNNTPEIVDTISQDYAQV